MDRLRVGLARPFSGTRHWPLGFSTTPSAVAGHDGISGSNSHPSWQINRDLGLIVPYTALSKAGVRTHTPSAAKWYLDIGAATHMASFPGNFPTTRFKPSSSVITVGNGSRLPVSHQTFSSVPTSSSLLYLRNVLVAPSLIKNLVPVRWLNRDNNVSIEFDPSSFLIKDLPMQVEML